MRTNRKHEGLGGSDPIHKPTPGSSIADIMTAVDNIAKESAAKRRGGRKEPFRDTVNEAFPPLPKKPAP